MKNIGIPTLSSGRWRFLHWPILTLLGVFAMGGYSKASSYEPTGQLSSILAESAKYFIERLQIQNSLEFGEKVDHTLPETRGGGGWGHGGGGHGAITLDPVSIISLLALGAFLINNILQLLRANMNGAVNTGRSLNNLDGIPLSPISFASLGQSNGHDNEPSFSEFFGSVGSLYYLQPKKRHMCMKRVVCNYINMKESRESHSSSPLKTKLFDFMISTVTKIVAPEFDGEGKDERCQKAQKFCSDAVLKDAKISAEFKVYSQVSTWLTKLAFNGIATG